MLWLSRTSFAPSVSERGAVVNMGALKLKTEHFIKKAGKEIFNSMKADAQCQN